MTRLEYLDNEISRLFREKEEHEKQHGAASYPLNKLHELRNLTAERTGLMEERGQE